MSSAPGRRDLRWFGLCAALAALFNLSNVLVTMRAPLDIVLLLSRLNLFFGGLHGVAWFEYTAVSERRRLRRYERVIVVLGALFSCLALLPGVIVENRLFVRDIPIFGMIYSYADSPPTTFGSAVYLYHAAALVLLLVHYARKWLRGESNVIAQLVSLFAIVLAVVHDALASMDVLHGPYYLDLALFVMVLAVTTSEARGFVNNARALEVSSRDLAMAQERLVKRERLAALGELAAVVAHEVRNPLAVVFNATAGLRKTTAGSEEHEKLVDIVQEEAEHLRDIVSDLLEFAHPRPPLFAEVALDEVVRAAVGATHRVSSHADNRVLVELATEQPVIQCDERLVRQAVVNLITNALQAPDRHGPVRIVIEEVAADARREEQLAIRVIDDGAGVAEDLRDRIFTPFYTTRPSGTGLGLAVVRSSADAHGGEILVSATPGGGATFTLLLPRRAPQTGRTR